MTDEEVRSPCISVCVLDMEDVCLGCYRSAEEIADWFMVGNNEKRRILKRSEARRTKAQGIQLN